MKKMILLLACMLLICTGCAGTEKEPVETQPVTEAPTEPTEPETTEPAPTDPPRDIKEMKFNSLEQAENLSEDDLYYIASHEYYTSDFVDLEPFDFFGQDLAVLSDDNGYEFYEQYAIEIYQSEATIEDTDVTKPLSPQQIEAIARERSHALVGDNSKVTEDDENNDGEEKTGRSVSDAQYIFCGENDSYVEYSIRYNEVQKQERNNEIVTLEMPRAFRRMYMKNMLDVASGYKRVQVLLGNLNKEYLQQQLDLLVDRENGVVIYREVTEREDENEGDYYLYSWVHVDISRGNYGANAKVVLTESKIAVNKETHIIERLREEEIKSVAIEDSAIPWPVF
ncbi:MAG: hypothetical protein IKN55_11985 [Oscillospiraceae bacterium]|nr:hypothetical protein [Oscillospiraceae bacterium]